MRFSRTFGFRIVCGFSLLITAIIINTVISHRILVKLRDTQQEGNTIFLTDIPEDYIRIKSGLGEDNPRCLLIVPLRLNEEIMGVIEIATLEVFEEFQIEFIERIGTSIASSISAAFTEELKNAKT